MSIFISQASACVKDMLERVKVKAAIYRGLTACEIEFDHDRQSFAFFFDPNFNAEMWPINNVVIQSDSKRGWKHASVHEYSGTYGHYLPAKVSKISPELLREPGF